MAGHRRVAAESEVGDGAIVDVPSSARRTEDGAIGRPIAVEVGPCNRRARPRGHGHRERVHVLVTVVPVHAGSVEAGGVCDDLEILVVGRGSRGGILEPIGPVEPEVDVTEPVLEADVDRDRVAGADVEHEVVLVVGARDACIGSADGQRACGTERVVVLRGVVWRAQRARDRQLVRVLVTLVAVDADGEEPGAFAVIEIDSLSVADSARHGSGRIGFCASAPGEVARVESSTMMPTVIRIRRRSAVRRLARVPMP